MKKYLISFLLAFIFSDAFAFIETHIDNGIRVTTVTDESHINFDDIKSTRAERYIISNSVIEINDVSEWQNWYSQYVHKYSNVSLLITDNVNSVPDNILHTDSLYKQVIENKADGKHVNVVRETNYQKVFKNARGDFLENLRLNKPNDKMLIVMDMASNMDEINSIMNSSYHFNPMILMNPVKTFNRSKLLDMHVNEPGAGAKINYIISNKLNNFGSSLYLGSQYEELYFNIGVNFDSFSYKDSYNEFDGFAYGIDVRAKQYIDSFWVDGLFGFNHANFDAKDIFVNDNVSDNPNGISEYLRFGVGYDYTKIKDFTIAPFIGLMVQSLQIMNITNTSTNLLAGITSKYDFTVDGIKYEYGASVAMDEKANWNVGLNVGFLSVTDNAEISLGVNAFKDEFDTNYKISANAKILF